MTIADRATLYPAGPVFESLGASSQGNGLVYVQPLLPAQSCKALLERPCGPGMTA